MKVNWEHLTHLDSGTWATVTIPINELPKLYQDLLIRIENDLSMELTLPAFLANGEFHPVYPDGEGTTGELIDKITGTA